MRDFNKVKKIAVYAHKCLKGMKYRFVTNERNEINKRNEKTQNKNKIRKIL